MDKMIKTTNYIIPITNMATQRSIMSNAESMAKLSPAKKANTQMNTSIRMFNTRVCLDFP